MKKTLLSLLVLLMTSISYADEIEFIQGPIDARKSGNSDMAPTVDHMVKDFEFFLTSDSSWSPATRKDMFPAVQIGISNGNPKMQLWHDAHLLILLDQHQKPIALQILNDHERLSVHSYMASASADCKVKVIVSKKEFKVIQMIQACRILP